MTKLYGLFLAIFIATLCSGRLSAQTQADALAKALSEARTQTSGGVDSVRVKGVVVDAAEKTRMTGAHVILKTGSDSVFTVTNEKGEFVFPKVPKGVAKLNISFMGYSAYTLEFKADGVQMDFGEIALAEGTVELGAVSVIGKVEMMTARGDTIVYNPAAFKTIEGDYAIDLIVKFPGIEVGEDGTITAQGETVKWALVDGKLMFGRDVMNTIENVKADDIEEVKVYDIANPDKPGAEYAKEKDDMQRVMDFTTKSKFTGMLNARVLGGLGKDLSDKTAMTPWGRYKMEGEFGLFNEKRVITVNGLANNTRDANSEARRRFAAAGRGSGYAGGGDGYGRRNNIRIGLSNSNPFSGRNKWQGDLGYGFSNNDDYSYTVRERIGLLDNTLTNDSIKSNSITYSHNFDIGVRKRWESSSLNINPSFTLGNGETTSYNASWRYQDDEFVRAEIRDGGNKNNSLTASGSLSFNKAFALPQPPVDSTLLKEGESAPKRRPISLSVSAGWNYSNKKTDGAEKYTNIYVNSNKNSAPLYTIDNNARSNGANASLLVSGVEIAPWLSVRANYSFSHTYSKTLNLYVDEETGKIKKNKSLTLTNNNIRNSVGAHFSLGKRDAKVTSNIGVNFNATNNIRDEEFPRNLDDRKLYNSVTPSFSVGNSQRNVSATKRYQWSMGYSTSSSNPSLEQLRDFVDMTNELSPVLGNPNLKQSYTHSASGSLKVSNTDKATSINISVSGGYTQNSISRQRTYISKDTVFMGVEIKKGAQLTTFRNISGAKDVSVNTSFSRPLIGSKFVIDVAARYSFAYRPSYETQLMSVPGASEQKKMSVLIWNSEHTPSANIGLRSNHSAVIEYGITNSTTLGYTFTTGTKDFRTTRESFGANFRLRFLKNFTLEGDYAYSYYISRRGDVRQKPDITQLLNGALSWDFAKRAGNLKFTVYDILNRNSSFTSTLNSQTLTNTWRQLMSRYCMLTASFRFNKKYGGQGGGQAVKGERGGMPGGTGVTGGNPGGSRGAVGSGRTGGGGGSRGGGMR